MYSLVDPNIRPKIVKSNSIVRCMRSICCHDMCLVFELILFLSAYVWLIVTFSELLLLPGFVDLHQRAWSIKGKSL